MSMFIKKDREKEKMPFKGQIRSKSEGADIVLKEHVVEGFRVTEDDGIIGKHTFGNLYKIDKNAINDIEFLKKIVSEAVVIANMRLVDLKAWAFGGEKGGITVIAVIQESHIALHTWNEYEYATLDIYTRGAKSDPNKAFEHVVKYLRPKKHQMFTVDRSQIDLDK